MTMKLTLRCATTADADELTRLVNAAYRPEPGQAGWTDEGNLVAGPRITPEKVRALPGAHSVILVLEEDRQIRACVHVEVENQIACIGMLATTPALQAQGLGSQLLGQAESHAIEHFGARQLRMAVLSSRPELLAFYERRGYVRTGHTETYPPENEVGQPRVPGLHLISLEKLALLP
jgi:ribosomal protein S18 acetylase RimI-like enzyme